jgi:hypothetical protein
LAAGDCQGYSVRRITDHQEGLAITQQARHCVGAGRVSAEDPVLVTAVAAKPEVVRPGHSIVWQRRRDIGLLVVIGKGEEILQFSWIESGQFEIEIGLSELL